jgi:hypothetical protein
MRLPVLDGPSSTGVDLAVRDRPARDISPRRTRSADVGGRSLAILYRIPWSGI